MNPFLEVPTGKDSNDKDIIARIKPGEINFYKPGTEPNTTTISFCSGQILISTWSFAEMDQALTAYVAHVKKSNAFGNIMIRQKADVVKLPAADKLATTENS